MMLKRTESGSKKEALMYGGEKFNGFAKNSDISSLRDNEEEDDEEEGENEEEEEEVEDGDDVEGEEEQEEE